MTQDSPGLGEKALSKVAEVGISSQLDNVDELNVDIRTNPAKLLQGEVDSVEIDGKGMVMKQDLRMENLKISTDKVAINPVSAVFGNIELTQPADAEAQVVLIEEDINRAFSSDYLINKLRGLPLDVEGQAMTIDVRRATMRLPGEEKFVLHADFLIRETGEAKEISATAIPEINANGHRIGLKILSAEGKGLTAEFILALFEQITNLLDLRNFDIPGMTLQLQRLEAQPGRLVLHATTQIEQLPAM